MITTMATWAARSAAIVLPGVVSRLPVEDRRLYLTFDDGPSEATSDLLNCLANVHASATFFLLGNQVERYASIAHGVAEAGHGIGNHSYGHLDAWKNRWAAIKEDLDRGSQVIEQVTGIVPLWMRPPYGRLRAGTLAWCRDNHRRLALWDAMAEDFLPEVPAHASAAKVVRSVKPGSIVVLHDGDRHQPHALEVSKRLVTELAESGWSFDRLPDSLPATV